MNDQKLDLILKKLEKLDEIDNIKLALNSLASDVQNLDQKVDKLDQRVDKLDQRVDKLDQRVDRLEQKTDSLEQQMKTGFAKLTEGQKVISEKVFQHEIDIRLLKQAK